MTTAETDRREVFLHAAAESGLQAGIDAVYRMGVDWGAENVNTIHRSRGQLHRKKIATVALELGTTPEQLWGVGRDREMSQKRHLAGKWPMLAKRAREFGAGLTATWGPLSGATIRQSWRRCRRSSEAWDCCRLRAR